ncbi:MAG: hypothetical protein QNK04_02270 [Myxococcota bacterium]|nr:hypothetical protein [Myxococcota bacterium]
MGPVGYFVSIGVNACLWTLVAAGCIAMLAYPDDPEALSGWALLWLVSLPFIAVGSAFAALSHSAYLDADSELLRFVLHLSLVLTVGLLNPFGWAVVTRLLGLGSAG